MGDGSQPVASHITPLTGVTAELLATGLPLDQVVARVRSMIPPTAVLVGQVLCTHLS